MNKPEFVSVSTVVDSMSLEAKAIRAAGFKTLLKNKPATIDEVAESTGLNRDVIAGMIPQLQASGLVVCDEEGAIVGSHGLTLVPTTHSLRMLGHDFYGWCAEDVVGIPAALREDAVISSSCFECDKHVTVELKQGEIASSSPADVRLWVAAAEVGRSIVGDT